MVADQGWRIAVDRVTCIGSGVCVGSLPRVFRLVDGASTPVSDVVAADDAVAAAAESCPMEAITVRDAEGNLIAPAP
ncbi:ferredoxin [Actinomycetes bacterium KLBMP 9797]